MKLSSSLVYLGFASIANGAYTSNVLNLIDTHCAGEPARIVTGGILHIPGTTMSEKRAYMMEKRDDLRKSLMWEPRGHNDMFGAYLTAPLREDSDFGIIFMDAGGYLNMCGHDTIAAVSAVVETGMVDLPTDEKATEVHVNLDTPAGQVQATATLAKAGQPLVTEVGFDNVESFVLYENATLNVPGVGRLTFDISFGGSFFVILPAAQVELDIIPENADKFSAVGNKIMKAVNDNFNIKHPDPELAHITTVDLVEFYGPPKNETSTLRNVVVFGDGQVDRSPCGTGTSAKLATLYHKGQIAINETFVYESILGTTFTGHVVKEVELPDGKKGIIPYVKGSAYIIGFNNVMVDPRDPLKGGFVLGGAVDDSGSDQKCSALSLITISSINALALIAAALGVF